MIKYLCDVCQKEITDLNEIGNFKIQERSLNFLKHQRQDQLRVKEYIFCIECARRVQENFKELRKQNVGTPK